MFFEHFDHIYVTHKKHLEGFQVLCAGRITLHSNTSKEKTAKKEGGSKPMCFVANSRLTAKARIELLVEVVDVKIVVNPQTSSTFQTESRISIKMEKKV